MNTLRVGWIEYLNLYPIFWGLRRLGGAWQLIRGHPAELNGMLREGLLDVSPSSSIEYLRAPGRYVRLEGHAVGSKGPIGSVLLFSPVPLEELGGRRVHATARSETSVALLEVVLKEFYRLDVEVLTTSLGLQDALTEHLGYLAIGDEAMVLRKRAKPLGLKQPACCGVLYMPYRAFHVYDLGQLWYEHTGLPFVFALWIARAEKAREARQFQRALDEARHLAFTELKQVAQEAARRVNSLTPQEIQRYWEGILYGLSREELRGLELFRHYCLKLGLL
jgi:chorismate dehydratase